MPRYIFPGYTAFLEAAASAIGHPEAAAPARRIATLSALANLCAQVGDAPSEHVPKVMAKAAEFRDQLHAAHRAAELMLAEVNQALGLAPDANVDPPPAQARPVRCPEHRARKS